MIEPIILFIILILINSIEIIGFHAVTYFEYNQHAIGFGGKTERVPFEESKMFLWKIKYWSEKYLGEFWSKPVCNCPPCMASLHSLAVWFFIYVLVPFHPILIPLHILYIFCLCGSVKLITSKFDV